MGKTRCDPLDTEATLAALEKCGSGLIGPRRAAGVLRRLYADYASVAARPYARASWEKMLRAAQTEGTQGREKLDKNSSQVNSSYMNDKVVADYWSRFEQVKPANILATTSDNANLKVRGSALIVMDAPLTLTYEKRGTKPQAIVMFGWSGYVSIQAMRYCNDHGIAVIILDWERDFLTVVAPPAMQSAKLITRQVRAPALLVAKALIRMKIEEHIKLGAISQNVGSIAFDKLTHATALAQVLMIEAHAAKPAWASIQHCD
jgi:hypothetical protein